jgi:hypothetical protein
MSILGPMLGRPWLRRRHAHLLRDAGRAINEAGYIPAGGIDHFVTIRGASRDSPVLVFLHGALVQPRRFSRRRPSAGRST